MKLKAEFWNEETDELEVKELPAKYEVCWRCEGEGKHVNPAIDGNGISPEKFDEDPDFRDNYFSGVYDIPCEECRGKRVLLVVDDEQCPPDLLKEYQENEAQKARDKANDWAVFRAESGYMF